MVLMVRIIFLFGTRTWSGNGVGIQNMGLQDDVRGSANEMFGEDHSCGTGSTLSVARASMAVIGSKLLPPGCVDVRGWFEKTAFAHRVDDQRGVSMFQVLISRQTLLCCTKAWVCLKRHLVVCCLASPIVVGGFVNDGRGYFGGRGIARLPSSSHC